MEELTMTKEEKVLWATWMASTDIWEYAVDIILDFDQMDPWELDRIRENGLHIHPVSGVEYIAFPIKSYSTPEVIFLAPYEDTLVEVINISATSQDKLNELIVAELKRIGFVAPWVSGMEVKNILVAKWGKNWNRD